MLILLAGTIVNMAGCSTLRDQYGDATIRRTRPGDGLGSTLLVFPEFSISDPGVHTFRAVNLPFCFYPRSLALRFDDDRPTELIPLWALTIDVAIMDVEGTVLFERQLYPNAIAGQGHGSPRDDGRWDYEWSFTIITDQERATLPDLSDYEVVVTIRHGYGAEGLPLNTTGHLHSVGRPYMRLGKRD